MAIDKRAIAKTLGFDAAAFASGWALQMGEYYWYSYANKLHANLPGETLDNFNGYWSPLVSPWNFFGLLAGLGLSLVPQKEGSNARKVAKVAGYAIIGAEGWGYAGHTQNVPSGRAFQIRPVPSDRPSWAYQRVPGGRTGFPGRAHYLFGVGQPLSPQGQTGDVRYPLGPGGGGGPPQFQNPATLRTPNLFGSTGPTLF